MFYVPMCCKKMTNLFFTRYFVRFEKYCQMNQLIEELSKSNISQESIEKVMGLGHWIKVKNQTIKPWLPPFSTKPMCGELLHLLLMLTLRTQCQRCP